MTQEVIEHVAALVEEKGSDAWWGAPLEALLPASLQDRAGQLQRGDDTMDVCGPFLLSPLSPLVPLWCAESCQTFMGSWEEGPAGTTPCMCAALSPGLP